MEILPLGQTDQSQNRRTPALIKYDIPNAFSVRRYVMLRN